MKRVTDPTPTELALFQLPGIVATEASIVVFDSVTDDQLTKAFGQIAKMDRFLAWWIGDLGIALQERRRGKLATEAGELRTRANACTDDADGVEAARRLNERAEHLETFGVIEYTRELCTAFSIGESYVRNCVAWSRFYQPANRVSGLTPKHHQVAMAAAGGLRGDMERARALLVEAQENQLTAAELRKKVNLQKVGDEPAAVPVAVPTYEELDAADTWAVANVHLLDAMTFEELQRHITQMQGIADYLEKAQRLLTEKFAPVEINA